MITTYFASMNDAYYPLFDAARTFGEMSHHRCGTSMELRPFSFIIRDPLQGLFTGAPRRLNYRFWMAETLAYIAGWGKRQRTEYAELLIMLNSNYRNFSRISDGALELNPMVRYGDGFGQGLQRVWHTLHEKPNSRQAYISMWNRDTPHSYEESPCLVSAQYFTTQRSYGALELHSLCNIRSNDLGLGVPYDVASLCMIQAVMAGTLNFQLGHYHHTACSLHYYEECIPNINPPLQEQWIDNPPCIPAPPYGLNIWDIQNYARVMLIAMHTHFVVRGLPGNKFDMGSYEDVQWVHDCCDVIRWRHPKQ